MNPSSEKDEKSVSLRRFPYPFKCAFTIANDVDNLDWQNFLNIYSYLHEKLNLPISSSFFLFPNFKKDNFSYFKDAECNDAVEREPVETLIQAGYLDTIHGFGEFGKENTFKRALAERAYELLTKRNLHIRYFSSHGGPENIQQVNSDPQYQYAQGDLPTSPAYHLDLTVKYGIRHLWHWAESGLTNIIGQDTPGLQNNKGENIIFLVKEDGRRISEAVSSDIKLEHFLNKNRLQQPMKMKDGQIVYNVLRFNGGAFRCVASNIYRQIKPSVINDLINVHGYMVLYQHLGCALDGKQQVIQNYPPYFSEENLSHLQNLSHLFHDGIVWVAPFGDMAIYNDVHTHLSWQYRLENEKVLIEIERSYVDDAGRIIEVQERDLAGITFFTPYPDDTTILFDGRPLRGVQGNRPVSDEGFSVSIPLHSYDYSLVADIARSQPPSVRVSSSEDRTGSPSEAIRKKNIYVHIGINKTASSLFQRVLMGINKDVLAPNNYYYEPRVSESVGPQLRDSVPLNDVQMSEFYNFFHKMHEEIDQDNIIIASNTFAGRINSAFVDVPDIVNTLKVLLQDFNVKIYAFVRRQDEFIESSYVQAVKADGYVKTFGEYFQENSLAYACDWRRIIGLYGDVFGLNNITVLPYEFFIAEPQAFYDHLFAKLGISIRINVGQLPRINPGITYKAIEMLRLCNPQINDQERRKLRAFMEQSFPKAKYESFSLFSAKTRQDLLDHYRPSNKDLFDQFMPNLNRYKY